MLSASILPGIGRLVPAGPDSGGKPSGDVADGPPVFVVEATRAVLAWARNRNVGLSSACGMSLALAACAAAWFSGGTRADIVRGAAALWAGYLVLAAGRSIGARHGVPDAGKAAEPYRPAPAAWLAGLAGGLAEAAVYLGLVAGAATHDWQGMWRLGIAVVGLVAVRNLMTACSTPYGFREPPDGWIGRICEALVRMAPGARILVVGVVAPVWGARMALLVLAAWAIGSVCYGFAGQAVADAAPAPSEPDADDPLVASATMLRVRDDGALARSLGALVRGTLLPLPPAILGFAAVLALAVIGLHGLPGALMIGPAIIMLLAAPGSANAHAGRFDWLVPVLLLASQVLYLAAAGQGGHVPAPVIFALVAVLLLRYADLAAPDRPVLLARPGGNRAPREYGTEVGWEGRVLFAGLTAAMGIATIGYLMLTAYLALLLGAKIVRSFVAIGEEGTGRPGHQGLPQRRC